MFFRILLTSGLVLNHLVAQVPRVLVRVQVSVKDDKAYAPSSDRVSEGEIEDFLIGALKKKGARAVGFLDLDQEEIGKQFEEKKIGLTLQVKIQERNRRWDWIAQNFDTTLVSQVQIIQDRKVLWAQTFTVEGSRNAWSGPINKAQKEFYHAFPLPDLEEVLGLKVLGDITLLGASLVTCNASIPPGTPVGVYYPGERLIHPITARETLAPPILVALGRVERQGSSSEVRILESYLPIQIGNQVRKLP